MEKKIYRSKGFIAAACISLVLGVLGVAVNARSTSILNFPALTALIPNVITEAITEKMWLLWDNPQSPGYPALKQIKQLPGLQAVTDMAAPVNDYSNDVLLNAAGLASFTQVTGAFESGKLGNLAPYNQGLFGRIVNKSYAVPSVITNDPIAYMQETRKISILMAGPGGGAVNGEAITDLPLTDLQNKKLGDVLTQTRISSFEGASSAALMAQKLKEQAGSVMATGPGNRPVNRIETGYPEQATKDMAKLAYINLMLQAEQLQMQAKSIQRESLMNR